MDPYPRIRTTGDLDKDPALFFSGFQDGNKKYFFLVLFFFAYDLRYCTVGTFTSDTKISSYYRKEVAKLTIEIKVFI
jgi:hypothetical protein